MMHILLSVVLLAWPVESHVTLYHTSETIQVQAHPCLYYTNMTVGIQSIPYCIQSTLFPTNLSNLNASNCSASSTRYTFYELSQLGFDVDDLLRWHVPMDTVEDYAIYKEELHLPILSNQFICNCSDPSTFDQYCEYRLYFGETIAEAMDKQFQPRERNMENSQWHERRTCYRTVHTCDFGLLCLDWRQICDGQQDCINGEDEENCDKLEFNECEQNEYRCANGMCIPGEYFLDGKLKYICTHSFFSI
jgi:hypothetical protein